MNEFERPFALDSLRDRAVRQKIAAEQQERSALAARSGILGIDRLEGDLTLRRVRAGRAVRVEGRLRADVTQACVVSLAPVAQAVDTEFAVVFVPAEDLKPIPVDETGEVDVAALAAEEDLEEALPDGPLDLGELLAQELAVALDPYPRAAGANFRPVWGDDVAAEAPPEGKVRPFADLKARLGQDNKPKTDRKKS
jgi:uncharacterized metal-binding protein YceD (DUF177 family)